MCVVWRVVFGVCSLNGVVVWSVDNLVLMVWDAWFVVERRVCFGCGV